MADIFGFGAAPDSLGFGGSAQPSYPNFTQLPTQTQPDLTPRQKSLQTILSLTPQNQRQQLLDAYGKDPELSQVTQNYNVDAPVDKGFQDSQNFGDKVANYAMAGGIGKTGSDMFIKPTLDAAQNFAQNQAQINMQHRGDPLGAIGAGIGGFVGGIAQAGYQSSPLASGVRLFGGIANQTTQAVGLNQGDTQNPIIGNTQSFSNQAHDQGILPTVAGVGMDLLNSAGAGDLHANGPGFKSAVRGDLQSAGDQLRGASDNIIARFKDSPEVQARTQALIDQGVPAGHAQMLAQGKQGGYLSGTDSNLTTPQGINDHINYIQQK